MQKRRTMKYSNLSIILSLLTPYENELLHQYIRRSGIDNRPMSLHECVEDWFLNGGFQRTFEACHEAEYQQALWLLPGPKTVTVNTMKGLMT